MSNAQSGMNNISYMLSKAGINEKGLERLFLFMGSGLWHRTMAMIYSITLFTNKPNSLLIFVLKFGQNFTYRNIDKRHWINQVMCSVTAKFKTIMCVLQHNDICRITDACPKATNIHCREIILIGLSASSCLHNDTRANACSFLCHAFSRHYNSRFGRCASIQACDCRCLTLEIMWNVIVLSPPNRMLRPINRFDYSIWFCSKQKLRVHTTHVEAKYSLQSCTLLSTL